MWFVITPPPRAPQRLICGDVEWCFSLSFVFHSTEFSSCVCVFCVLFRVACLFQEVSSPMVSEALGTAYLFSPQVDYCCESRFGEGRVPDHACYCCILLSQAKRTAT